jgi:uncharacterized protein YjaG (DUF416 family)
MFLVKSLDKETEQVKSETHVSTLSRAIEELSKTDVGLILDLDKEVRPGSLSHPIIYAKNFGK